VHYVFFNALSCEESRMGHVEVDADDGAVKCEIIGVAYQSLVE
jgi:hypothetical protein